MSYKGSSYNIPKKSRNLELLFFDKVLQDKDAIIELKEIFGKEITKKDVLDTNFMKDFKITIESDDCLWATIENSNGESTDCENLYGVFDDMDYELSNKYKSELSKIVSKKLSEIGKFKDIKNEDELEKVTDFIYDKRWSFLDEIDFDILKEVMSDYDINCFKEMSKFICDYHVEDMVNNIFEGELDEFYYEEDLPIGVPINITIHTENFGDLEFENFEVTGNEHS